MDHAPLDDTRRFRRMEQNEQISPVATQKDKTKMENRISLERQSPGYDHLSAYLSPPLPVYRTGDIPPLAPPPPPGGETAILYPEPDYPADTSSVTEHFVKIYSHNSRSSLLGGGSFDPAFRGPGGFRAREGYTNVQPGPAPRKMYIPNSMWTWSFAIVTFVQTLITLALECYVFANFQINLDPSDANVAASKTVPTFLALYSFGFIYELVLVYDALRMKNTIQIIGLCVCNIGLLIYGAVQVQQIKDAVAVLTVNNALSSKDVWGESEPFLIVIPCIVAMGSLLMVIVAWKLYDEFAWTIYKHISADLRMKRRYLTYQIYIALLKFDFFFFLGFTVQFVVIVTNKSDVEFALTLAAIPVTIIILICAAIFVRKETSLGMVVIITLYFGAMAYFLFKLVRMYQPSRYKEYLTDRRSLTFFAVITLVLIVLTIINACMCMRNFHKGLKPHINKKKKSNEEEKTTELSSNIAGQMPGRMMID